MWSQFKSGGECMSGTCACNVVYSVEIKHNFEQRANRCLRTQRGTSSDQRAFSESPLAHKAHVLPMLLIDTGVPTLLMTLCHAHLQG